MNNRHCVFSTANNEYVPCAVVSLLSFGKRNSDFDMFILSSDINDDNERLCRSLGIEVITLDLSRYFYRSWQYPQECYYHFKAPELFSNHYDYSVYIDGDTYCNSKFIIDSSFEKNELAGVSFDTHQEFFASIGEYDEVVEKLGIDDTSGFARKRIQTGVLVFNNVLLAARQFFDRAVELYDLSIKNGVPRKGDDSLLSLLMALYPAIAAKELPVAFNTIDFKLQTTPETSDKVISDCVIYHCVARKPWFPPSDDYQYHDRYFAEKWLETMINSFSQSDIKRCFPNWFRSNPISSDEVAFYWYSVEPPNFGDWITPYLVNKICKHRITRPVDPTAHDECVIISTGSIMRLCGSNTIVWGSGIRDRYQEIRPGKSIRSIRGPITRERIIEVGGECPPIYGDPALLLPRFYTPTNVLKRYQLGLTPHTIHYERIRDLYAQDDLVTVIDLRTNDIENVIDQILACERIVSSSLHGIIAANAYDVPVRWIKYDDKVYGDDTKFHDHFASIGRSNEIYIDARIYKKISVEELLDAVQSYNIRIDLDKLWDASVFHGNEVSKYIRYQMS